MELEPIGAATLVFAAGIFFLGTGFGLYALAIANVFGAAAVVQVPALGGASIPPGPVVLAFLAVAVALRPDLRAAALASLCAPKPGAWFLGVVAYCVLTAFFMPRIFAGMTDVYAIARSGDSVGVLDLPLAPRAGNLTQACYMVGDLVCFAVVAGAVRRGGAVTVMRGLCAAAFLTLFFAAADVITYVTHKQELLDFIRNANYRMLDDGEIGGLKRIVGSFPEAGAYCYAALGLYAFTLNLWLADVSPRLTGALAGILLATLVLATSTTAYASLAVLSLIVLLDCALRLSQGTASRQQLIYVGAILIAVPIVVMAIVAIPSIWQAVSRLLDATVVNKLASQSGVERMRWNHQALQSFLDTFGFGAGLGSVRASSFPVAILSNIGVIGLVLFAGLIASAVLPRYWQRPRSPEEAIGRAGASACLALVAAASVSAGSIDLGLFFSIFAGLAAAAGDRARAPAPTPYRSLSAEPLGGLALPGGIMAAGPFGREALR